MKVLMYDLGTNKWSLKSYKKAVKGNAFLLFMDHVIYDFFISDASYFFILNSRTKTIEYVSPSVEKILKINKEDFNLDFFVDHLTVKHKKLFLKYEKASVNFMKSLEDEDQFWIKYCYYLVLELSNEKQLKVYHQVLPFEYSDDGEIIRSLIYNTVVSSSDEDDKLILEIIDYKKIITHFEKTVISKTKNQSSIKLTQIELRIINSLSKGMTSRQISIEFGLSELTINTHRKRILKKTNCHSTSELITMAIKKKWL